MAILTRIARHIRLSVRATQSEKRQTPPFLIVFINSICNLTCEHCFYWKNLNQRDDLTYDEFKKLSEDLGDFENLNLSGGEPFIRSDFAEICDLFIENNGVKQIYVPTNGYFTERTETQVKNVLKSKALQYFVCEISLDGMPEYHDKFRGSDKSFSKAMETYDMLTELQKADPRLRIHTISTATHENMDELYQLTEYLFKRCPAMDHHNLAVIRGDRKNASLEGPALDQYGKLYDHVSSIWKEREEGRFGSSVEPMLQVAKRKTIEAGEQYVPCLAGNMVGVVYANGDVSVCENHPPLGNLRKQSFFEIWDSAETNKLREDIKAKKCYCTNEVFLWPSIVFNPLQLAKTLVATKFS